MFQCLAQTYVGIFQKTPIWISMSKAVSFPKVAHMQVCMCILLPNVFQLRLSVRAESDRMMDDSYIENYCYMYWHLASRVSNT